MAEKDENSKNGVWVLSIFAKTSCNKIHRQKILDVIKTIDKNPFVNKKQHMMRKKHKISFFYFFFFSRRSFKERVNTMKESTFQHTLIKDLRDLFPGCIVMKTDAGYIQGFPDILLLTKNKWAALEVKASPTASHRPNQDYWVETLNRMGFASFVHPGNKREVLESIKFYFGVK